MGTKNDPGTYDCFAKAEPDEPMFVLLARDKHAPTLVWLWATLRELDQEEPAKVAEARDCMAAMLNYQISKGRKPIGLAQAALAGVLELIRTVNGAIQCAPEVTNPVEMIRRMMAAATFETEPPSLSPNQKASGG